MEDLTVGTMTKVLEITGRLDHLSNCADWIARETVHTDNTLSQTGTLMAVMVEDLRDRISELVVELQTIALTGEDTTAH